MDIWWTDQDQLSWRDMEDIKIGTNLEEVCHHMQDAVEVDHHDGKTNQIGKDIFLCMSLCVCIIVGWNT